MFYDPALAGAACAGELMDPDAWYSDVQEILEGSADICNQWCPVKTVCLEHGLEEESTHGRYRAFGVRGGLLASQRQVILDAWRQEARAAR